MSSDRERESDNDCKDLFKEEFKRINNQRCAADYPGIINFREKRGNFVDVKSLKNCEDKASQLGLIPPSKWEIFPDFLPGAFFIKNPFTVSGQIYWSQRCLCDYPLKPNKTNLDRHYDLNSDDSIWELKKSSEPQKSCLLYKLRWTTLGYHHNWDTKVYSLSDHSIFPEDLAELCKFITAVCGFHEYNPEAAIVNYYHMDSVIRGHTDHSEFDHVSPLISISFGQSAVFLLGGVTRNIRPTPMFLHSGDIVIMSNESRLAYHAVPKIVAAPHKTWINDSADGIDDVQKYLDDSRININVRQVHVR